MPRFSGYSAALGLSLGVVLCGAGVTAEDASPDVPKVSFDQLFKLPNDTSPVKSAERRVSGANRSQWEERFRKARTDLLEAQRSLRKAQGELEEMASKADAWQLTAPGAQVTPENSPVSFKLRQEIRGYREDIERLEAALTELRIEANLAGVPAAWQETGPQPSEAQDRVLGRNAKPGSANSAVSAK